MPSMFASLHRCSLFILLESNGQERASSLRRHIPLNQQTEQFISSTHHRLRRQQTTGTGSRKRESTGTREVRSGMYKGGAEYDDGESSEGRWTKGNLRTRTH
ncbi:hypothetical protein EYF80_018425 [Liparis tanakae]|uniref:Uncharacterized protein n=1 Tax=Liparis tanakae TaxID=230148 RepID=A0A4Z2I063_9TELE|nr:hypothetical protein EYF80_018425 [Liparis tanakae]